MAPDAQHMWPGAGGEQGRQLEALLTFAIVHCPEAQARPHILLACLCNPKRHGR